MWGKTGHSAIAMLPYATVGRKADAYSVTKWHIFTTLCKTRHVYGEVYRCLAADACRCPHSLAFAFSHYCRQPDGGALRVKACWYLPEAIAMTS